LVDHRFSERVYCIHSSAPITLEKLPNLHCSISVSVGVTIGVAISVAIGVTIGVSVSMSVGVSVSLSIGVSFRRRLLLGHIGSDEELDE
jgi:hypothetical protein